MSLISQLKADIALARQKSTVDMKYVKFLRNMLPWEIRELPDRLILNDNTIVRCWVLGLQKGLQPGYPVKIRQEFLDDIMSLSSKNCIISYSFSIVPMSIAKALEQVETAIYSTNVSIQRTAEKDKNLRDVSTELDRSDFFAVGELLHYGKAKQLSTTLIITVWAKNEDTMRAAESRIKLILDKHIIKADLPKFKMMEAFRASLPIPTASADFQVELLSDYAAQLAALQNPNSRLGEYGYLIGVDRKTGKLIIIDADGHVSYVGATGSGKTVAMLTHLRRCHSILKKRCIYITPKFEEGDGKEGTDYRNVAAAIGDTAAILDIGRYGKYNINPLQILYTDKADKYVYSDHKELLLQFFNVLFKEPNSMNHDSMISKTLDDLYLSRGIIRDKPETWINAAWPNLQDLHDYWQKLLNANPKDVTLKALVNKTAMVTEWDFLCKPTTLDLSKSFLVFDLSGCPPSVRDAMNVFVVGLLGQLFGKPGKNNGNGTIIAVDESHKFLEDDNLAAFVMNILRLGRSAKLWGWFGTQSVNDFLVNPKAASQFIANISRYFVLGKDIRKDNIPVIKSFYKLSDMEANFLFGCKAGEGIARLRNEFVPLRIELSDEELDVIHGKKSSLVSSPSSLGSSLSSTLPQCGFSLVHGGLNELVQKHGIILDAWCNQSVNFETIGYVSKNVPHAVGRGRFNVWIRKDLLDSGKILNQNVEHYVNVIETAGFLIMNGYEVKINHYDSVDISVTINGKKIAFEIEISQKSNDRLIQKYQDALKDHAEVYFITTFENVDTLSKVLGAAAVIPRGAQFKEFLTEHLKFTFSLSDGELSELLTNKAL